MRHSAAAETLRRQGHDVVRAAEIGQARADDAAILHRATAEGRTLVTLDKDFGDWVILPLSRHAGVIRVRVRPAIADQILEILLPFLAAHDQQQFRDRLVIVSRTNARWIETSSER